MTVGIFFGLILFPGLPLLLLAGIAYALVKGTSTKNWSLLGLGLLLLLGLVAFFWAMGGWLEAM